MIIIKKKIVLFIILFIFIFLSFPAFTLGSEAQWEIIYDDNNDLLYETITVYSDANIEVDTSEWNLSPLGEKISIQREVANWQVYDNLPDKFPVEVEVKDYILFNSLSLKGIDNEVKQSLYSQIISQDTIKLCITLPGIKNISNAEQVEDFTYIWEISKTDDLEQKLMLKANTLQGFFLGLFIFALGFFVISIVFIFRMRKVHKLIEEEYSLERAREELIKAQEAMAETEELETEEIGIEDK